MNYIGSKQKLSSFLKSTIQNVVGNDLSDLVFCDLFAGTGIVGRSFKPLVKKVIANDIEYYSYVLNKHYIGNSKLLKLAEVFDHLNKLKGTSGFIFDQYAENGTEGRLYFSEENGKKIDAIRTKIAIWKKENKITDAVYYFLLTSLIESADKVANTAVVYGAYLKNLKKTARETLTLRPATCIVSDQSHCVYNIDANELIENISGDILYLDPPYNARQYGANYHLLTTIAKYDNFSPKGKTGLREYYRSDYCKKNEVQKSFEDLIKKATFKYIFLSYNNEGLMPSEIIEKTMKKYGEYSLKTIDYQRFKADKTENRNHKATATVEYLHILKKDGK